MRPAWPIRGENRAFSIIVSSTVKRAEPVASHSARRFCGRRFVGLGFAFLVFVLFAGDGSVVFEPVTAPGDGNRLGVMKEAVQDRASRGHVAQKFTPLLQWPIAGHDGGPV